MIAGQIAERLGVTPQYASTYRLRLLDARMIVTAGYNVGGPEVEDCLLTHPAVAECGVIGKPDAVRGMIIKAFVVLRLGQPDNEAMVEALQAHVRQHIAAYKYPREIQFVTALPRTDTGKLQRFKLRELA